MPTRPDKPSKEDHRDEPPTRKGKVISLGTAPDDDPIYTNAGWNFIMGKNLNPNLTKRNG